MDGTRGRCEWTPGEPQLRFAIVARRAEYAEFPRVPFVVNAPDLRQETCRGRARNVSIVQFGFRGGRESFRP